MLTRALLPVLCCLMALLFAACGSSPSSTSPTGATKAPASKQIAILAKDVEGVPDLATLDPGLSTDAPSITAIDMVFTGLVQLDDNLQVQPQLASSYSVAADGVTWTFHLRPNLKFSDGTPLTSADVAWLPMEQVTNAFVQKPCLAGTVPNAQDLTPPNDWVSIYISSNTPCADTSSFQ